MSSFEECGAIVSDEDADLRECRWIVSTHGYAARRLRGGGGKKEFMHRLVLSRMIGRPLTRNDICDHINRNRLDNRRENLRLADHAMNAQNRGNTGVCYINRIRKWKWQCMVRGIKRQGVCKDREEAIFKRKQAMKEMGHAGSLQL